MGRSASTIRCGFSRLDSPAESAGSLQTDRVRTAAAGSCDQGCCDGIDSQQNRGRGRGRPGRRPSQLKSGGNGGEGGGRSDGNKKVSDMANHSNWQV